ncbi:ribosome assembly factor SBDS [Histomonas meleagridis]|uniref:ribosome assembly factor SBDS n=1 Tax=Histomonas meleagridis TaxID=135588 RepID=UPI003559F30C|nr:ribosome assembly factor SBDS [Histomonas meleagridis]KAH0802693.1 ribosome assembly factor SBDS [Histomonas meleagridis]
MSQFQVVTYQKNGVKVEVLGKPGKVTKFREGQCSLADAIADDRIYTNSSRGDVASEADIGKLGLSGRELLEEIMKNGKYSLTAQEKREIIEKRKLEVINFIHQNFIEPSTRTPHPVTRIESALQEIKARIDPDISAERNVRALLPKLTTVIRLSESQIEGTVVIPNTKLGQAIGICYNLGTVTREEYGPENAYISLTVSPGKFDALNEQLSKMTNGQAVFKIAGASCTTEAAQEVEKTRVRKKPGKGGKKH